MAKILVVDERPTNREILVMLLRHVGHQLLEAADGSEALAILQAHHPDLAIMAVKIGARGLGLGVGDSSLQPPTPSPQPLGLGIELIRRIRSDPALAQTPIVFYIAAHKVRDARRFADELNVHHFITKPVDSLEVLKTVDAALRLAPASPTAESMEPSNSEWLEDLAERFARNEMELRSATSRLAALIDLDQELVSERDPEHLLQHFCEVGRELIRANYAAVGVLDRAGESLQYFYASAADVQTTPRPAPPPTRFGVLGQVIADRRPLRFPIPPAPPFARKGEGGVVSQLPTHHTPIQSFLAVPLVASERSLGWAYFINRIGTEEFSVEDERLAVTLAGQVGVAFENLQLYAESQKRAEELEQEIIERRRAEQQIREQTAILDKAHDAIIVCDMEDNIVYWNEGAARIYGWMAAEAIGENVNALLRTRDEAGGEVRGTAARRSPHPPEGGTTNGSTPASSFISDDAVGEFRQKTKDGRDIIVESHWTVIRDDHAHPKAKLVISNDITERKRLEAQVLRNQRLESIGTLAGGIAHDLNNMLTPILMSIEILQQRISDPNNRAIIDVIRTSAEHGAEMVQQILSFARGIEGDKAVLRPRVLLEEIETMLRCAMPRSIELAVTAPEDLWPLTGDATQLHQMLVNLCVNARDAMPRGGQLAISAANILLDEAYARMEPAAKPGPHVVLKVSDTGAGMPREILDRIFDPFFTTKGPGKGTGLGLSTAMGIVKSHGGFIHVQSEVGKGSRFCVYLPASESRAPDRERHAVELPGGQNELILVVDDDAAICEITRQTLESFGYRVLTAGDGAEAVAAYARHRGQIGAVITDMMMPIMDGPATVRALQKIDPAVRIIAATGMNGGTAALSSLPGNVRVFLPKPYAADKLLTTLHAVLSQQPPRAPA